MARRCFFSFHYQDVIDFRANVVRNHNITKDDNGGFFVSVRPTHLPGPDAKGDGVHLI